MPPTEHAIRTYQELADRHDQRGDAPLRDRFLVLAADAAFAAGRRDDAERLRSRLVQQSPHHLLKPYGSLAEALKSPDVLRYVDGLRRSYPPEKAAQLLAALPAPEKKTATAGAAPAPSSPPKLPPAGVKQIPRTAAGIYGFQEDARSAGRGGAVKRGAGGPAPRGSAAPTARNATLLWPPAGGGWRDGAWDTDASDAPAGAWLATFLFWIVLGGALALTVYLLAQPFLLV